MKPFQIKFVLILFILTGNTGCSVVMALSGEPAPDFYRLNEVIDRGDAFRWEMEFILGHSVKTVMH